MRIWQPEKFFQYFEGRACFYEAIAEMDGKEMSMDLCYRASRDGWMPKIFTDIVTIKDQQWF